MLAVTLKSLIATITMGVVVWLWQSYAIGFSAWQVTLIGILLGTLVYCVGMILLRVEEFGSVWRLAYSRLHKSNIKE